MEQPLSTQGPPPAPASLKELTVQELKFVDYFAPRGKRHGAAAVRHAGMQTTYDDGTDNAKYVARDILTKRHLTNAIAIQREILAAQLAPTAQNIVAAYSRMALADRRDAYDPETGALLAPHLLPDAFQQLLVGYDAEKGTIKLESPQKSLEALAKIAGMFEVDNKQKAAAEAANISPDKSLLEIARRLAFVLTQANPQTEEHA